MYQFVKITVVENNSIKEHLPFQNLSSNLRNALVDMHLKLRIQYTFFSFSSITNMKQNLISYKSYVGFISNCILLYNMVDINAFFLFKYISVTLQAVGKVK